MENCNFILVYWAGKPKDALFENNTLFEGENLMLEASFYLEHGYDVKIQKSQVDGVDYILWLDKREKRRRTFVHR